MTVLEIMIVLAIVGSTAMLVRTGFRAITKADLVENATELAAVMKRAGQLAIEQGEMHRVTFDFERHAYVVEICQGATSIVRNEQLNPDPEKAKDALERGQQRMGQISTEALASGDPEEATRRAMAIAGHHVADRVCSPASGGMTGDVEGKGWIRQLSVGRGIKLGKIWVQHLEDGVSKDQVAVYFFPTGSAEKAVIELTDGSDTFTVLVHGLTGRIELRDGPLRSVDDHMLRNALGNRDAERDALGADR